MRLGTEYVNEKVQIQRTYYATTSPACVNSHNENQLLFRMYARYETPNCLLATIFGGLPCAIAVLVTQPYARLAHRVVAPVMSILGHFYD